MLDIEEYIFQINKKHPEFSIEELYEICDEFMNGLHKKTKENKKTELLIKYLVKEFELKDDSNKQKSEYNFKSIPKSLFNTKSSNTKEDIIVINKIHKRLGTTEIFDEASLKIKDGDKIALIGKNGAGKSTFLKMIISKEKQDLGDIIIKKGKKIGFLSQDLFWEQDDRFVRDEMLTALPEVSKKVHRLTEIEKKISDGDSESVSFLEEQDEIIERLVNNNGYKRYDLQINILGYFGFSKEHLDMPISKLSGGEQTKLQIAKFLVQEVDVLILDEPTNHLDIEGIMFLENFCKIRGKTLICISHDKTFLNSAFNRIVEISNKKLNLYHNTYDDFLVQKEKDYELQMKHYDNQQKYIEQQNKFIERFRYKASKASQVQSRIKMLDKIEKLEAPEQNGGQKDIKIKTVGRLPNLIMRLKNVEIGYWTIAEDLKQKISDNVASLACCNHKNEHTENDFVGTKFFSSEKNTKKSLFSLPTNIEVTKDMKIGVVGKNGIGKTTLIKSILGELEVLEGKIEINQDMKIGSYSQIVQELDKDDTVISTLVGNGVSYKDAMSIIGTLSMKDEKMDQKIGTLSGGERAKVALAKMLLTKPHVIIMDEPTNHLDIQSKETIKKMLDKFDGVSIIVSHDRDFLKTVSNVLRVIKNKKLTVFQDIERGFEEIINFDG